MKPHFQYLRYVLRHKWFVFLACLEYHDWRLILRGIIHDWTKFLPREWFPYVQYFYGGQRKDVGTAGYNHQLHQDDNAFNVAWNHHQKKNDHHWQFWILNYDDGRVFTLPMSDLARKEMVADWRGAGRAQGKPNTWEWYAANKDKMTLHPNTRQWVEEEMKKLERMARIGLSLGIPWEG